MDKDFLENDVAGFRLSADNISCNRVVVSIIGILNEKYLLSRTARRPAFSEYYTL